MGAVDVFFGFCLEVSVVSRVCGRLFDFGVLGASFAASGIEAAAKASTGGKCMVAVSWAAAEDARSDLPCEGEGLGAAVPVAGVAAGSW